MNIIRRLTLQSMKQSKARTLVTILGIVLSAAMFTAVTTMVVSFRSYLLRGEIAENGDYFVRYDYAAPDVLPTLRNDPRVTRLGTLQTLGYASIGAQADAPSASLLLGAGNSDFYEMMPVDLIKGHLPQSSSELVITELTQYHLRESGQPYEIGAQLTLPITVSYQSENVKLPETSGAPYDKTFTIVGITGVPRYLGYDLLELDYMLTLDDGSTRGIWGLFFAQTAPKDAYTLADATDLPFCTVNSNLLELYGVSRYFSIYQLIVTFAAILIVIIMAGAVSLIYNAFSISVSERTKQFGLLTSVGATRKQIRQSVLTEAVLLGLGSIPLGIVCGYAGIAVTLHLTHDLIDSIMASAVQHQITLQAVPSLPAFAAAALVAMVTVLISAWIPARRAAKVTPIAAIRQTQEFRVPRRGVRVGRLTQKLFGLPAALARKYNTVNRRKYRATIVSLTISMVLFVASGSFIQQLNAVADEQANLFNFDFGIEITDKAQVDAVRAHPALKDSSLLVRDYATVVLPDALFCDRYRTLWNERAQAYHYEEPIGTKQIELTYLEDAVLKRFLTAQGIDPAPYLDPDDPLALVTDVQLTRYTFDENERAIDRTRERLPILNEDVDTLSLLPSQVPSGVIDRLKRVSNSRLHRSSDGTILLSVETAPDPSDATADHEMYEIEVRPNRDGNQYAYYIRDSKTGRAEQQPADVVSLPRAQVRLGAHVHTLPHGMKQNTSYDHIDVILPLSAAPNNIDTAALSASASDYEAFLAFLKESGYAFTDHLKYQMQYRDYVTMLRIFSYGFLALISLICICNVFNTISTNIALRRKDFGMLRSVGMKEREIDRMLAFECMQYGFKAILWGTPLSVLTSLMIARLVDRSDFAFPASSLLIAASFIFVTVFITMFYAVSKLRGENPIEAIRAESV